MSRQGPARGSPKPEEITAWGELALFYDGIGRKPRKIEAMNLFSFLKRRDPGVFRELELKGGKRIFVSPMPFGAYDPGNRVFRNYQQEGIDHVLMLLREDELHKKARKDIRNIYLKEKIGYTQFELMDLTAPSVEVLDTVISKAVTLLNEGQKLAIHCHAGTGRTAVVACCIAMAVNRLSADDGIKLVMDNMEVHMVDEQLRLIRRWATESVLAAAP